MDEEAAETRRYRVEKTLMEMLSDRGYVVSDFDLNMTMEQFLEARGANWNRDTIQTVKQNDANDKIIVFFTERLTVKAIKEKMPLLHAERIFRAIFVVQQRMTSFAESALSSSSLFHLEAFQETELLVNISRHEMVPIHQVLTDAEKTALLEKYNVKETQLPGIQVTDPVARYYEMKAGQVVRIIRPSETAGRYATYRRIIAFNG